MVLAISLMFSNVAMAKKHSDRGNSGKSKSGWNEIYKKYVDQYKKWEHTYTKKFMDVEKEHWANKYIERMSVKNYILGDGNGRFSPNKYAKNIEVIVMILRIIGWEEDAKGLNNISEVVEDIDAPEWSIPYLAYAYKKGIITEDELEDFDVNKPAKRYMVAKYIIRAIGMEDKASDNQDEDLDFDDDYLIPKGDCGYIYLINELGLMSGYRKIFNPKGNLTRAEMAILFSRLDDKIDSDKDEVEMGKFVQIINGIITIKDDSEAESERYLLSENVVIYDSNNNEIELTDLKAGDQVQLEFFDHKVVYIEVSKEKVDKILQNYKGKITKVVKLAKESKVTVVVEDKEKTFVLGEDIVIKEKGKDEVLKIDNINIGDIVIITKIIQGEESYISQIEIQTEETVTKVYEGIVMALTETTTTKLVTIRQDDDKEKTFIVDEKTVIKKEGQDEVLEAKDIKLGDVVKITEITKGDSINTQEIEIQIEESQVKVYEGEVIAITDTMNEKLITVQVENESKIFSIDDKTVIKDKGEDARVEDIMLGDKVRVTEITEKDNIRISIVEVKSE
jgi:hypothetical protein